MRHECYSIRKRLEKTKCSSSGLVWTWGYNWAVFLLLIQENPPPDPSASWLYIDSQNASGHYILEGQDQTFLILVLEKHMENTILYLI